MDGLSSIELAGLDICYSPDDYRNHQHGQRPDEAAAAYRQNHSYQVIHTENDPGTTKRPQGGVFCRLFDTVPLVVMNGSFSLHSYGASSGRS